MAMLFRDADLIVRHHDRGGPACVVTFDSFTDVMQLDRPAFGEALFEAAGVDAVHIQSRDNRWYQYPAMAEAAAAARRIAGRYQRVIAYGSSMGGYAALRLADAVGATVAMALSPQCTIDARFVPWERRWIENQRNFVDVWERSTPPPALAEAWVVYDPLLKDRRHVELLERQGHRFHGIAIDGGGHPIGAFLAEVGLLRPAILDVVAGRFDPDRLRDEALRRRAGSAQALLAASSRTAKSRIGRRLALLRQAARLAPDDPLICSRLALELAWAGRFGEAVQHHERALRLQPDQPTLLMHLSCSLEIAGDRPGALRIMQQACATPGGDLYRARRDALAAPSPPNGRPGWLRRVTGQRPVKLLHADV